MFNAIANTLFVATRNTTTVPTHHSELRRHEERKREELHRLKTNAFFHATASRRG